MTASDRETKIFSYLREHKIATVEELAAAFYASTASVRRDLNRLQQQRLVKRTHGGAMFVEKTTETGVYVRINENRAGKERVAKAALEVIPSFETVFIDDSSTAFVLAEQLDFSNKLVVTNGLQLATALSKRRDVDIFLPGGSLLYNTGMLSGSYTIDNVRRIKFDLAITSCTALDKMGTYERSQDSAILKATAIGNSETSLLLFDSQKLVTHAPHHTLDLARYKMAVTDAKKEDVEFFASSKCKIFLTKEK